MTPEAIKDGPPSLIFTEARSLSRHPNCLPYGFCEFGGENNCASHAEGNDYSAKQFYNSIVMLGDLCSDGLNFCSNGTNVFLNTSSQFSVLNISFFFKAGFNFAQIKERGRRIGHSSVHECHKSFGRVFVHAGIREIPYGLKRIKGRWSLHVITPLDFERNIDEIPNRLVRRYSILDLRDLRHRNVFCSAPDFGHQGLPEGSPVPCAGRDGPPASGCTSERSVTRTTDPLPEFGIAPQSQSEKTRPGFTGMVVDQADWRGSEHADADFIGGLAT